MQGPGKNSYKELDNEKKFLRLENSPPPPITFLMVRPVIGGVHQYPKDFHCRRDVNKRVAWRGVIK